MKTILFNNIHHTSTKIQLFKTDKPDHYRVSVRAMKACAKRLCGHTGCTCGNDFGARMDDGVKMVIDNIDENNVYLHIER